MARNYTYDQLNAMGRDTLRRLAADLGVRGMWKAGKADCIEGIMSKQAGTATPTPRRSSRTASRPQPLNAVSGRFTTVVDNPDAPAGQRTTTMISVSCGASSGDFPVGGKTVGQVKALLKEALNIDYNSDGVVNGSRVSDNYPLRDTDQLEFVKKAGRKG